MTCDMQAVPFGVWLANARDDQSGRLGVITSPGQHSHSHPQRERDGAADGEEEPENECAFASDVEPAERLANTAANPREYEEAAEGFPWYGGCEAITYFFTAVGIACLIGGIILTTLTALKSENDLNIELPKQVWLLGPLLICLGLVLVAKTISAAKRRIYKLRQQAFRYEVEEMARTAPPPPPPAHKPPAPPPAEQGGGRTTRLKLM